MSSGSTCPPGANCSDDTAAIAGILVGVIGGIFLTIGIFALWWRWGKDPSKVKEPVEDVELPVYTPADSGLPSYGHSQSLAAESTLAEPTEAQPATEEGGSSYQIVGGTSPRYEPGPR
jgi:hypothetical protein